MSSPTHVEYHYHYYGTIKNFGHYATGQGTINNISTTDYLQSSSDEPETMDSRLPKFHTQHQPAELENSPETAVHIACAAQSEDQPISSSREIQSEAETTELKNPPEMTVHSARKAPPEAHPSKFKVSPWTPILARVGQFISNTGNENRIIRRNIVVFGQASCGTAIINLLTGSSAATVSSGPASRTASNTNAQNYISHGDNHYTFWDTPGLDAAENGTVSLGYDVHTLLNLVKNHGVNLLVYCVRGNLAEITRVNYDFFWKILCVEKVPIVLVVSGLGGRDVNRWWQENLKTIAKMKMLFAAHACITSWKGHDREYEESAEKVWKLVREHCAPNPWYMTPGCSVQAQQIIVAYEKHYKARPMRKLLREFARCLC